ncbi:hypothetical protein D3Z38_19295, partial [Clostridiales bacterium]|nr:hypothetical protein [Clostridiales bacterium]
GWESVGGTWYLFDDSGWMETGWQSVGGTWYYLKGSGAMAEGWQKSGGAWYYLEPGSGAMATGWKSVGGTWYLLSGSGAMLDGWQKVGGLWYYMEPSGAMAHDRWVGNYYVGASGAMLTDAWVGSYYVGSDGLWVPGKQPSPSQGGQEPEPPKPAHTHSWLPVYAQEWVEDEPAWDEEVWERRLVCECGYVAVGETGSDMTANMDAHQRQTAVDFDLGLVDKWCVNAGTMSVLVGTIHHDAAGHYEQVKTGEECACGASR